MKRTVLLIMVGGVCAGAAWAKGHYGAPVPSGARHAAVGQRAAAFKMQQQQQQNAFRMQKAATSAAIKQQQIRHNEGMKVLRMQQHAAQMGPGPRHVGFRHGPAPMDLHRWRRGPAPHPHYRNVWYDDVWYDAYGYPYYGTAVVTPVQTVVTPAPVVTPVQTVVTPAPVVTPVQTVVTPAQTVVTPVQTVVTPAQTVVTPAPVVAPTVVY